MTRPDPSPLPDCDPVRWLRGLPAGCGVRLLEARGPGGWGSPPRGTADAGTRGLHLLAADPEVEFTGGCDALVAAMRWLQPDPSADPWARVLIGSLSYELGSELDPALPQRPVPGPPPVDLAGFRAVHICDAATRRNWIAGEDRAARAQLAKRLEGAAGRAAGPARPSLRLAVDSLERAAFCRGVEAIRDWIRRGDVYQVNLSRRLSFPELEAEQARVLFAQLATSGDAPFAAYLESRTRVLVSNSPERFLRVWGRDVETGPIKGTSPRGATSEEDRRRADALCRSPKDAAEHLMIVDLERNDLGRVCEIGSVRVAELAALRSFASVHHLVSSVQGRLRPEVGAAELLAATFPGGSVTGAPKRRAMQIIDALEPVPRDVYTGAIGYFDAAGGLDLSIAIRTAVLRDRTLHLHAGGGIVADSEGQAEWLETEAKVAAFRALWDIPA